VPWHSATGVEVVAVPRCPSMARANVPGPADRIRPSPGARDMRHASVGSACLPTARVESASARRTQRCQATGTCVRRECAPHLRRRPPRPANPPTTRSQMSGQRTAAGPWQERADQSCRTGPGARPESLAGCERWYPCRSDFKVGHIRRMYGRGEWRALPAAGRWLSGVPGRVQDGGGTVRCSRTQLDLMGHDPKPASR
jgi:hypothetical protein